MKDYLEPILEPLFNISSFGYRPGRSAHDALVQCEHNCRQYSWVVDLDIKGFFDNISHEWMMKMVSYHTQEKWVLLYTERWLKAGIEQADSSIAARAKGTPQGGVITPRTQLVTFFILLILRLSQRDRMPDINNIIPYYYLFYQES